MCAVYYGGEWGADELFLCVWLLCVRTVRPPAPSTPPLSHPAPPPRPPRPRADGTNGPHTLSTATVKGDCALMLVVSANEKQWARNEARLREMPLTFRA
jgi:hypothetical protein